MCVFAAAFEKNTLLSSLTKEKKPAVASSNDGADDTVDVGRLGQLISKFP